MSKFSQKTMKKVTLMTVILAILLAAALVIGALFGVERDPAVQAKQTVTVSMNSYVYETEETRKDILDDCKAAFKKADVVTYEMEGDILYGDEDEYVLVFASDVQLKDVVIELKAHFAERTADAEDSLYGKEISVTLHYESVVAYLAKGYVSRVAIAGVVFAVLACAYVALRFKRWDAALIMLLSIVLTACFTAAFVALFRIPVSAATVYALILACAIGAVGTLMTLNRIRATKKDENKQGLGAEELVLSSVAWKEGVALCSIVAAAILLAGVLVGTSATWFALTAFVGIVAACAIGTFYAPLVYLPLMAKTDERIAEKSARYKGAEKTSQKAKKAFSNEAEETAEEGAAPSQENED